jgi:hypothetical protein
MESTLINPEPPGGRTLTGPYDVTDKSDIDVLHEIGSRIAAADPLHTVLNRVVQFVSSMVACDSVFIYVLEGEDLVLRASKRPHSDVVDRLSLRVGEGITGWVAEHRQPVFERQPQAYFLCAHSRSGHHQICQVGAKDEQHHNGRTEEKKQRGSHLELHRLKSLCSRLHGDLTSEKPFTFKNSRIGR